jgi:arsenate reductase (thioredoxin)
MPDRRGLIVLCTGNSCRSQMAEAFLRHYAGDRHDVYSAGTEPAARIHPLTVQVMEEAGFQLSGQRPKGISEYLGRVSIHTAIIVCDGAARSCPAVWPGMMERLLWPFEDPAAFAGTDEQTLAKFREVRDAIEARVREWVGVAAPGA